MYEITNTTKKEGHFVGQHKNGWHIGLSDNHFLGPGKIATVESINQGFLELQRQGLIAIKDVGKKMPPIEVAAPPTVPKKSAEQAVIDEAAYPEQEPNFVVKAPSLNQETEIAAEETPAVTVANLKKKR